VKANGQAKNRSLAYVLDLSDYGFLANVMCSMVFNPSAKNYLSVG